MTEYSPSSETAIDQPGLYFVRNVFSFPFAYLADYFPRRQYQFSEQDYSPSSAFEFPVDWEEIWRRELTLELSLDWAVDSINAVIQRRHDSQWEMTAPDTVERWHDEQYAVVPPAFTLVPRSLAYAVIPPAVPIHYASELWAMNAPEWATHIREQAWSINPPVYQVVAPVHGWALRAPDTPILSFSQQWLMEALAVWTRVVSSTAYLFTLEQTDEGIRELPISNFSGQFRSGQNSYLQASIPNATRYADIISAYAAHDDTEMVIHAGYRWSDGSYTTQEIARVTLRNMRLDYGTKSSTVSLDGMDTRTNANPKAITLTGASYRSVADSGLVRYRCSINFDVRPGDTVTINGETFIVGELSYQVDGNNATMEVAQAA